jgi:hypothetical protein
LDRQFRVYQLLRYLRGLPSTRFHAKTDRTARVQPDGGDRQLLARNAETVAHFQARGKAGKVILLMFDEQTEDLAVRMPYGDSGRTTFVIRGKDDWDKFAPKIVEEDIIKVMKRLNHMPGTVEGCATHYGTLAGPIMTGIGAWCVG